jgi:superfamily II DNA or RNA helicase
MLWMRARPAQPARVLRVRTLYTGPAAPRTLAVQSSVPETPSWLLRSSRPQAADTSNIDVRPRAPIESAPSRPAAPLPDPPSGLKDEISTAQRPTAPPGGPTLADRLRAVLAAPLDALLPGPDSVLEWPADLKPYQLEGVHTLLQRDRLLLADDMGLGKTIQAIAAIRIMCVQGVIERVLLILPASLIDQWRRELERWAPELRVMIIRGQAFERAWKWRADAHVTIVGYETFRSDFTPNPASPPRLRTWDLVILDEAQKIKNRDSEVSIEVKQLGRRRSWAMTGTPLENKVDDLASIMEFVDHHDDGSPTRYTPGPALLARHRELQLRRRKFDVLHDLPPKQVISISLQLLPRQLESYTRAETEGIVKLRAHGPDVRIEHVLELITRLKQVCNADPSTGESAKFEDIRERLNILGDEGHRALLFSQYTDDAFGVGAAARALAEFSPLTYTGSMSSGERDATIQRFKDDASHRALILSLKAGGVGLNLQEASYVFHIDRWWNPAVERQAEDRSHRMGQLVPVTVLKYTCSGTIEERIERVLADKQQLFDEIIDDVSLDVESKLTRGDLFGLFGLEAPPAAARDPERRSGLALEQRCAAILTLRGWDVQYTPRSRDGGVDLIATRVDEVGLAQTMYVQCKDHARPVGVEVVRELLGVLPSDRNVRAVLASSGGVTGDAATLAKRREVLIWDARALDELEAQ